VTAIGYNMTMQEPILELNITADTNDADYLKETWIIKQEQLDRLMPLIEALKAKGHYNWVTSEYGQDPRPMEMYSDIDIEVLEEFMDHVPCGEYGVHTITSVRVRKLIVLEDTEYLS